MSELWHRASAEHFRRPRRPDFHHLLLCTAGKGTHEIDFEQIAIRPRGVIHVRPGQVHAFGWNASLEGVVVMFAAQVLSAEEAALARAFPPCCRLSVGEAARLVASFEELLAEYGRHDGTPLSRRVLQHLLAAAVLRVAAGYGEKPVASAPSHIEIHRLFEAELERGYLRTRKVEAYARRLGYTPRTLARVTAEVRGVSPKAMIDARVVLEAKRLLVLTVWTIGRIALHLGFSEPTNFTKFFRQRTGMGPEGFRLSQGTPARTSF